MGTRLRCEPRPNPTQSNNPPHCPSFVCIALRRPFTFEVDDVEYAADTVILATGATAKRMNLPGEEVFVGALPASPPPLCLLMSD